MRQLHTKDHLEQLIPDYLNGHSTPEDSAAIEAMMAADQEFEQLVEYERTFRLELKSQNLPTGAQPNFQALEEKIQKKSGRFLFGPVGLSASLAFALLLMVSVGNWSGTDSGFNDFETLSSAGEMAYENLTLRVVGIETVADREYRILFTTHDLSLVQKYPSHNVYDVTLDSQRSVDQLIEFLEQDERVRSVHVMGEQP